jgi:putative transposase
LSPPRRRQIVVRVRQRLGVSERRACRVLDQPRSTQRRPPYVPDDEPRLVKQMTELAQRYGRYGYRRITALLQREGWRVNHKRIERLWRREGLKVPQKQPKRGRLWLNDGSCIRLRPLWKDHVWTYDFVEDRTHDGRKLRLLVIVDEYTRECLAIDVARRMTSEDVLERLTDLFIHRGVPDHIRSDNGGEFTAKAVRQWLDKMEVKTLFIEPAVLSTPTFCTFMRDFSPLSRVAIQHSCLELLGVRLAGSAQSCRQNNRRHD